MRGLFSQGRSARRCGLYLSIASTARSPNLPGRKPVGMLRADDAPRARQAPDSIGGGNPDVGWEDGQPRRAEDRLTDTDMGQSCCWNATPANNISPNGHNAQKVSRCLSFLLHPSDGAFQIAPRLRNSVAVVAACPGGGPESADL